MRDLLATLRPSGNAGDQDLGTGIIVSHTNSGGSPIIALLKTADLALLPSGIGDTVAAHAVVGLAASVTFAGGGSIEPGTAEVFLIYSGAEESKIWDAFDPGSVVDGVPRKNAPSGATWTGHVLDATSVRVEADVLLPPGATGTLTVYEVRLMAWDYFQVRLGGATGDTYLPGLSGSVRVGGQT